MAKKRILALVLSTALILSGCTIKPADKTQPTVAPSTTATEPTMGEDTTTDGSGPDVLQTTEVTPTDTEGYALVDMTLGRPLSSLYTYKVSTLSKLPSAIVPSTVHEGFFESSEGLLAPDMTPVVYPVSSTYKILEPFIFKGAVYFRVEDMKTDWKELPEIYTKDWWSPLGGYAVLDADGKEVIAFGKYDYIDRFVGGNARVYSAAEAKYYIIDATGEVLKTYPVSEGVAPYELYANGYIYMRSDVAGKHSHALLTWEGEEVIPYNVYKDDINPKYLGNGTFLVTDALLLNGTKSGMVLYASGKEEREMPTNSYDVFTGNEGKYVTGVITNGLAGPLAKWEYVVTDYAGKVLIDQGVYTFTYGGWGAGYALANNSVGKVVLLDKDCKEVKIPEYMEITGRYSMDSALFVVKVTKNFELWRYPDVPVRYDNPVGLVDKDFNWVIAPGMFEYLRNLPLQSVTSLCEFKQGDKGAILQISKVAE